MQNDHCCFPFFSNPYSFQLEKALQMNKSAEKNKRIKKYVRTIECIMQDNKKGKYMYTCVCMYK